MVMHYECMSGGMGVVFRVFFRNVAYSFSMPHSSLLSCIVTRPPGPGTSSPTSLQSYELELLKTMVIKYLRVSTCRVEMEHYMVASLAEANVFLISISSPPSPFSKCP